MIMMLEDKIREILYPGVTHGVSEVQKALILLFEAEKQDLIKEIEGMNGGTELDEFTLDQVILKLKSFEDEYGYRFTRKSADFYEVGGDYTILYT